NDARCSTRSRSAASKRGSRASAGLKRRISHDGALVLSNINRRSPRPSDCPWAYHVVRRLSLPASGEESRGGSAVIMASATFVHGAEAIERRRTCQRREREVDASLCTN